MGVSIHTQMRIASTFAFWPKKALKPWEMSVALEYVRETYQVPAYVGARVRYTGGKYPMDGTITGERAGMIRVRLDGHKRAYNFHPKWEMEYLPSPTPAEPG